ncbi:MAG: hypothetical protein IKC03_00800 [Oscillospiraceae bacterium]|nr:hypothetical protein [Oscillospiraceae bacterium]
MKGLVLAEKPSLMRAIQSAYQNGKYPFSLDFAAFHGHLLELANPGDYTPNWKKWRADTLPMIPEQFMYLPKDQKSIQSIMGKINSGNYDFLVNACDAAREGELIFWSFYEANHLSCDVKRLWCSTTVEKDLQAALHDLKPAAMFQHLRESAAFRAQMDWLTGMNFSRAVSIKCGKKMSLGRVMTPALKIIVDREKEIAQFKSTTFYEIHALLDKGGTAFPAVLLALPDQKQTRFLSRSDAETVAASIGQMGQVIFSDCKEKRTKAPTLYSTLEMQKDANRYHKWSADKTDAIAQELYDAGFLSYPRTECRYLPTSMVDKIPELLKPLANWPELAPYMSLATSARIKETTTGKAYINDAELTDHHAVIPTETVFDPNVLSADQRKLYLMVAKRFLSIFLPPYVVENTTVLIESNGQRFKASGRIIKDKGFSVLYDDKSAEIILPDLKRDDTVGIVSKTIKEGKTTPPDRYTERTLLDAMANAGRFVSAEEQRMILKESAGLGTGATRSSILKKLKDTEMVRIEKNCYIPTDFGMSIIGVLGKDRDICSPGMTAQWEGKLRDLETNGNPDKFKREMIAYIEKETRDLLATITGDGSALDREVVGKCPICGKDVVIGKTYYLCSDYKNPCTFIVSRSGIMGASITPSEMRGLLSGKPSKVKTLVTKDGRQFKSAFVLSTQGKIELAVSSTKIDQFTDPAKMIEWEKICKCPICNNGQIYRSKNYYLCTHKNEGCSFIIRKTVCGAAISETDIKDMVSGRITSDKIFTWKSGKTGVAKLRGYVTNDEFKIKFVFE